MKTEEELIWEAYILEKNIKGAVLDKLKRGLPVKLSDVKDYIKDKPYIVLKPTKKGFNVSNTKTGGNVSFHMHNHKLDLNRGSVKNIWQVINGEKITR